MKRNAVSVWMVKQILFCPVLTASARSVLTSGKNLCRFIHLGQVVTHPVRVYDASALPRSGQSRNCPVCRIQVTAANESWVMSDAPTEEDIAGYILNLADEAGHPHRP